jgi:hypothetical protein
MLRDALADKSTGVKAVHASMQAADACEPCMTDHQCRGEVKRSDARTLGQLRKPENESERARFWRTICSGKDSQKASKPYLTPRSYMSYLIVGKLEVFNAFFRSTESMGRDCL